jgi:hypothetical protein
MFLTHSRLDLVGPMTAVLRLRSHAGGAGRGRITWRTRQSSFAEHQVSEFEWPVGREWQEVQVTIPENAVILHVRIHPPADATGLEVQSIEFEGGENRVRFAF